MFEKDWILQFENVLELFGDVFVFENCANLLESSKKAFCGYLFGHQKRH